MADGDGDEERCFCDLALGDVGRGSGRYVLSDEDDGAGCAAVDDDFGSTRGSADHDGSVVNDDGLSCFHGRGTTDYEVVWIFDGIVHDNDGLRARGNGRFDRRVACRRGARSRNRRWIGVNVIEEACRWDFENG